MNHLRATALVVGLGLGAISGAARADDAPAAGSGNIAGKVTWAKGDVPTKNLTVPDNNADKKHCESKGPIPDESVVVDPASKGAQNIVVYLKAVEKIHDSYPQDEAAVKKADEEAFAKANGGVGYDAIEEAVKSGKVNVDKATGPAVFDQVYCKYIPHAFAVRAGQRVLFKNPEPCNHNVNSQSFEEANTFNLNMAPKTVLLTKNVISAEGKGQPSLVNLECNVHNFMKAHMFVFPHPYFAVTGKDGSFTIKNVPPGDYNLVVRECNGKFAVGGRNGVKVTVTEGKVEKLDLEWK
ncbi:MAG TPA: hypothetical protein VNC50_18425 [Planctomycetia bacterium]|jgi:plastocyanin|nr:hypothetical protein [Planctomycetia bacterium]